MKKKINFQLFVIAGCAIIATLILAVAVFYNRFQIQVSSDLKTIASVMNQQDLWVNDIPPQIEGVRVTLVNDQGKVVYDSEVNPSNLDNHANRPEIVEAIQKGEGEAIRKSTTVKDSNIYYYALKLEDGMILRLSKNATSMTAIFMSALPLIILLLVAVLVMISFFAHYLTASIMKPIEKMAENIDQAQDVQIYKELIPFVSTIKSQHDAILNSAKMRQDFTANVTHELKTPLTAISGYSELIETGMATTEDVSHFARQIHKSSDHLLSSINDIIRLSELDAGIEEVFEEVDLYSIALTCSKDLAIHAEKYGVNILVEGNHECVLANQDMMKELIYNLVDNAIRYNQKRGQVLIKTSESEQQVHLSVKDDGIGISKKHQERIFERFYRVDKSRSKATGGTGLGLAIVKHIVLAHHAALEVFSGENQGCEILVHFNKHS